VHLTEAVLAELRARYGDPHPLEWTGNITAREHALVTYDPKRMHDVTLFIMNGDRIALIRKHGYPPEIWRPPGGGVREGEPFETGAEREALEETGLRVRLERYLVASTARFVYEPYDLPWRTHVFLATTVDEEIATRDPKEIESVRWGTLDELRGPIRQRLLETGAAFWRYRVALHDAALEALDTSRAAE
jgi:ADP-ribose pyrophosphatase YjhB (NUDIX family)